MKTLGRALTDNERAFVKAFGGNQVLNQMEKSENMTFKQFNDEINANPDGGSREVVSQPVYLPSVRIGFIALKSVFRWIIRKITGG